MYLVYDINYKLSLLDLQLQTPIRSMGHRALHNRLMQCLIENELKIEKMKKIMLKIQLKQYILIVTIHL